MFGLFGYSKESEWEKWLNWQRKNKIPEKSYSIEYFSNNYFKVCSNSLNKYYDNFGDFAYFIEYSYKEEILEELLHFYDSCKGYARYFTGDPSCITSLRTFLKTGDDKILLSINFNEYLYDYKKVHAYTVASFSLSTLVMRIAAHNLFKMSKLSTYNIELIIIPTIKMNTTGEKLFCEEIEIFQVCPNCKRLCDKLWGAFSVCVDCHKTKICSKCGKNNDVIVGNLNDSLPKCCN